MERRKFIESIAALGLGVALAPSPLAAKPLFVKKTRKYNGPVYLDDNLVCIISDMHVYPGHYQSVYFERTINEILALNPLPHHVLCLGDVAYLTGKPEEYAAAKHQIDRLEGAGMQVTITMGNHDRRANFAAVFPEKASASELPGRMVYTVRTPRADFILLDSLQEGDNHDKWITPGAVDAVQQSWLKGKLSELSGKPVFVMAHHPLNETKVGTLLLNTPACCGYIYGHEHLWKSGWTHINYRDRTMLRTLCVPSTGHWGDIGFTLLRLEDDHALASFVQKEFFFPKPLKDGELRPAMWDEIERDHKDAICVFPY